MESIREGFMAMVMMGPCTLMYLMDPDTQSKIFKITIILVPNILYTTYKIMLLNPEHPIAKACYADTASFVLCFPFQSLYWTISDKLWKNFGYFMLGAFTYKVTDLADYFCDEEIM